MSGGIAYVLDEDNDLYTHLNKALVSNEAVKEQEDIDRLKSLIEEHAAASGSVLAERILADFDGYITKFKKIIPYDYDRMCRKIAELKAKGISREQAEIDAFYINSNGKEA